MHQSIIVAGLFEREVRRKHSVSPCNRSLFRKSIQTVLQNRIEVAEKHEWNFRLLAYPANQLNYAAHRRTGEQRPFARPLDRGPVRNRIAERHAQFDYVRTRFISCENN